MDSKVQHEINFKQAFQKLNPQQKEAVYQIEGPVLVLAGPGSGKTQVLAMRIAHILNETDADMHNILCLTYTESASIAMRKRLVGIIGPGAHRIHIFTFHAFCNQVIRENPELFGNYRQLELISDLEKIEILFEILNELEDDHILKKLKGDVGFDVKRLDNLFALMKKESLSAITISRLLDRDIWENRKDTSNKDFFYQRKHKTHRAGDLKEKQWNEFLYKTQETKEATVLFEIYRKKCWENGRFDYQDMILWVLEKFEENEDLLAKYQERYQYVLVDEYQDTNGSQNQLLELLTDYWDQPNVFVVGDDDQAIYKFQGANLMNIREFDEKYHPEKVILNINYRSTQQILDASQALIENNEERMSAPNSGLSKKLIAARIYSETDPKPALLEFPEIRLELAFLFDKLDSAHQRGVNLSQIAIIYRNHAQVEKLIEISEKKQIPYNARKTENVLQNELIICILRILEYIQSEYIKANSREDLLFEIMHYKYFEIQPLDIARIPLAYQRLSTDRRVSWRKLMKDKNSLLALGVESPEPILKLGNLIDKWIQDATTNTLQVFFEAVINESMILRYVMSHENRSWMLTVITTFFDWIKTETQKVPNLSLAEFLELVDKMRSNQLALPVQKINFSEQGVHFLTAHAAKGLEFERVYLMGCTDNIWNKKRKSSYSYLLPKSLRQDSGDSAEDERRLFFVAMTRAKSELSISYSNRNEKSKDLIPSQYMDELRVSKQCDISQPNVNHQKIEEFQFLGLRKMPKELPLIDAGLVEKQLQNYRLSVTGMNKYIKCPLTFYFENILNVPTARNKYMGFGRAIHRALQVYFEHYKASGLQDLAVLIKGFVSGMKEHQSHFTQKEFDDLNTYGHMTLTRYYENYDPIPQPGFDYITEHKIDFAEYRGIPIKGILDRIDLKVRKVHVVDYKTGNFDAGYTRAKLRPPKDLSQPGGEYWRQIVFYKILIDGDKALNWQMDSGEIDFIEPHQKTGMFSKARFSISDDHVQTVGNLIIDTWEKIQKHEFGQLCAETECHWCNFVKNDYMFDQKIIREAEDLVQEL